MWQGHADGQAVGMTLQRGGYWAVLVQEYGDGHAFNIALDLCGRVC